MKISFILPNLVSGGAERVVTILSRELVAAKYTVDIVLLVDDKIQYDIPKNVNVIKLHTEGMSKSGRIRTLRRYFKEQKEKDKVIVVPFQDSCLKNALIASAFLKIKIVACERNNPYRKGKSFIYKLKAQIPFLLADFCVYQTIDARKYYKLISKKRCQIIMNPINIPQIEWTQNTDPSRLITVGRLHKQKNYYMLIDAMKIVRLRYENACVHVYGEGELLDELEAYVKDNSLQDTVLFLGIDSCVQTKMAESSVFLLASDYEGISNAMLEAMSIGMPIVCTDCPIGGARMMLANNAGVLSPVGDAQKFANEIIKLLNNPERMKLIGKNAKSEANKWTPSKIAAEWMIIFNKL